MFEVTLSYFWIINLIGIFIWIYLLSQLIFSIICLIQSDHLKTFDDYRKIIKNKWVILFVIYNIFLVINPIKINGTNSNKAIQLQNFNIENTKELPKKKEDKTFENFDVLNSNNIGIHEEDLK